MSADTFREALEDAGVGGDLVEQYVIAQNVAQALL